jgi:hypothetical protein
LPFSRQLSTKRRTPSMRSRSSLPQPEPPRSADRSPQHTFQAVYDEFTNQYPYKGNEQQFLRICQMLADPNNNFFEFMYDDLLMNRADDYRVYESRCSDIGEDRLDFDIWAKKNIREQRYKAGVITAAKLEAIVDGYYDEDVKPRR